MTNNKPRDGERVPDRDEYATYVAQFGEAADKELSPVLYQQKRTGGRAEGEPDLCCSREAKVWHRGRALCEEHARASELWDIEAHWGLAEEFAGDWLRQAQAWYHEDLAALARGVLDEVQVNRTRTEAQLEEARGRADSAMVEDESEEARAAVAEVHGRMRHVPGTGAVEGAHFDLERARRRLQQVPAGTFEDDEQKAAVERAIAEADEVLAREARRLDPPLG